MIEARREERFLQLQRLLNLYLCKHKETARRLLNFTVPRVISFAPQTRFVEDNTTSLSLLEIFRQHIAKNGADPDTPIAKYYDRLLAVQSKTGTQVSGTQGPGSGGAATAASTLPLFRDIVTDIQNSLAPKTLFKEWAAQTFNSAPDFWHFRKQFTLQLGLADLCEFAFHLNRLNPDMMYIHRDSGLLNVSYFRFDLSEETGELVSSQPVPFRLTNSIQDFVTKFGIQGPMTATMIATASCLTHPNYKVRSILCAILRDEIIAWYKRLKSNERMVILSQLAIQVAAKQLASRGGGHTGGDDHHDGVHGQQQQQTPQLSGSQLAALAHDIPDIGSEQLVTLVNKAANAIMSRLSSKFFFGFLKNY